MWTWPDTLSPAELRSVPVVGPPKPGRRWKGVPHGDIADALVNRGRLDLKLPLERADVRGWTGRCDADFCLRIPVPGVAKFPAGVVPVLAALGSNAQKEGLTFYCGIEADGDLKTGLVTAALSKHRDPAWNYTTSFDLKLVVERVWEWWLRKLDRAADAWVRLSEEKVSMARAAHLLMNVGRKEIIPWSRVGAADKRFRAVKDGTYLDLHRAVVPFLQQASPLLQLKSGYRLGNLWANSITSKAV